MDNTNFDLNGKVYRRVRDDSPVDFVYVSRNGEDPDDIYVMDERREHYFFNAQVAENGDTFTLSSTTAPSMTFTTLTLDDVKEKYKDSIRTFKTVEDGERIIKEALLASPYADENDNGTVFSVSISDRGEALELLMENDEGSLFYRAEGDWVEVTSSDGHPTIFDQKIINIQPEDNDAIVSIWDEHQTDDDDLYEEDILPFAAVIQ